MKPPPQWGSLLSLKDVPHHVSGAPKGSLVGLMQTGLLLSPTPPPSPWWPQVGLTCPLHVFDLRVKLRGGRQRGELGNQMSWAGSAISFEQMKLAMLDKASAGQTELGFKIQVTKYP